MKYPLSMISRVCMGAAMAFAAGLIAGCPPTDPNFQPPDGTVEFRDDFDAGTFDADWEIVADDDSSFTLEDRSGFLSVTVGASQNDSPESRFALLLREAEGDFVLLARMEFDPQADRHIAGLVIEGDDQRRVSFGLASLNGPRGSLRGVIPVVDEPRTLDLDTTVLAYEESQVVLRIRRVRDVFELSYSEDGQTFTRVGTATTNLSEAVRVGVGAATSEDCTRDCRQIVAAQFDFFEISSAQE
jgi:regulation of enolase protein 1 (concanavalin A-like superfamily)